MGGTPNQGGGWFGGKTHPKMPGVPREKCPPHIARGPHRVQGLGGTGGHGAPHFGVVGCWAGGYGVPHFGFVGCWGRAGAYGAPQFGILGCQDRAGSYGVPQFGAVGCQGRAGSSMTPSLGSQGAASTIPACRCRRASSRRDAGTEQTGFLPTCPDRRDLPGVQHSWDFWGTAKGRDPKKPRQGRGFPG